VTSARWSFEASREAPGRGRRAISEFAGQAEPTAWALSAITLCVTEAITNVVVHAYRHQQRPGRIELDAELDGHSLCIRVRDHGHGLHPRLDSPGLGLGLPLIAQLSTRLQVLSPERGGTEIVMRFNVREYDGAGRR
jgi:serine/threonine-protein kinase RsbW